MNDQKQPRGWARAFDWLGKFLVVGLIIIIELALRLTHSEPPPAIYLAATLAVVTIYRTWADGWSTGLLNAAIIVAYVAYRYSLAGQPWTYSIQNRQILYAEALALPMVVLQVGWLKRREQLQTQAVAETERRYRGIIEHAAEGIFRVKPEGKLVLVNQAFARITGFDTPWAVMEEVNSGNSRFVEKERRLEFFRVMSEQRWLENFEALWHRRDGSHIWVSINAHQVLAPSGGLRYYEGSIVDITARKQAEMELLKEKTFSESLVESNANGIMAFDPDLTITVWNPAMERISGVSKSQVIGRNASDLSGLIREQGIEHMKLALQGRRTFTEEGPYRVPLTGKEGYSKASFTPIYGQTGDIIGGLSVTQEVTARVKAEQKLKHHARYQEALHEIGLSLVNRRSLKELFPEILHYANELMDATDGCLHMVAEDRSHVVVTEATGSLKSQVGRTTKPGEGLVGKAWKQNQAIAVDDYDSWPNQAKDTVKGHYGAAVAVPMQSGGEVVAILAIAYEDRNRRFYQDQLDLLEQFSNLASVMLDNARLFASLTLEVDRREQSEQLARQSEERFRLLTETANDAIISTNDRGEVVYINTAASRLFGYDRHDIVGRGLQDLLPNGYYNPEAGGLEQFLPSSHAKLTGGQVQMHFRHKDGRIIPVEVSAASWQEDTSSNHTFYTLIVRDITERLENQERFRLLVEGVKDYAIFMLDLDGRVTSWNAGAERLKGYSADEIIGKHFSIFYTPEDQKAGVPQKNLEVAKRKGKLEMIGLRVNKDGRRFHANVLISALYDDAGHLKGFSKVTRDISEQYRLDQMKSDFVSMVSHQLKTPVALIRGYVDNMLSGITGELNQQQRQYLRDIQEISAKNYNLISDLLSISRLERGVVSYDIRPVELREIVTIALRNYRQRLDAKGLKLELKLGSSAKARVAVDAFKTAEAVGNVIDNALRFTDQGGITVSAEVDKSFAMLKIRDTGTGMNQETIDKLFQRDQVFVGSPQPANTAGLGLFIAREFIQSQNGSIEVTSKLGRGSEFTFRLPLAKVEPKRTTYEVKI